ncbi:MAG: hypothetical protein ACKO11_13180 [Cuspidothrix sp.]
MKTNRIELAKETAKTHRQNIRTSLEHRLQVARMQNDDNLLHQLEAEMREYNEASEPGGVKTNFFGFLRNRKTMLSEQK